MDSNSNKAFYVQINHVPEGACVELITHDWKDANVKMIRMWNAENSSALGNSEAFFVPPATLDNAIKICDVPANDSDDIGRIAFYFENDTSERYWKGKIDTTTSTLSGS